VGAPCLLSVKPWPKIATGQPPAGGVPDGTNRLKYSVFVDCTAGTPVRVPTAGMTLPAVSQSGELNRPNTMRPTAPGKTSSAGTATNEDVVEPLLRICRFHWIVATLARGKLARIVAGVTGIALMRSRIFSSTAVALCVLKTLAVTIVAGSRPEASIASRSDLR